MDEPEGRRRGPSRGHVRKANEHPDMRAERPIHAAPPAGRAPAMAYDGDEDDLEAVADELDRLLSERSDRSSRAPSRKAPPRAASRPAARAQAHAEDYYDDEPAYAPQDDQRVDEVMGALDRLDQQVQDMSGRRLRPVDDDYIDEPQYEAEYDRPRRAPAPAPAPRAVAPAPRAREEYRQEEFRQPPRPAPRRRSDAYFTEVARFDRGQEYDDFAGDYHDEDEYEEIRPPRARPARKASADPSLQLYKELGRRIDALRKPQEEAFEHVREELGSLRNALGGLSKGTQDRVTRQNAELRRLADMVDRLRADKSNDQFAKDVRREVAELKSIVGRSNVEGALQTLEHGYAHILQRLDELSRGSIDPRVLRGVTVRLNEIEDAFASLPKSEHLLILDERIGSISERMEELLHRKNHTEIEPLRAELREVRQAVEHIDVAGLVEGIDDRMKFVSGRLDDLEVLAREQRGLDSRLSAMEQRMPEPETISRLQGRLEDIVGMMSDDRAANVQADQFGMMDTRLDEIVNRLERMERIAPASSDKAAFNSLERRLEAISDKIEVIEKKADRQPIVADGKFEVSDADKMLFTQLQNRMDDLSNRLDAPRGGVTTADLDRLRAEIGAMRAAVEEPRSTAALEQRINELAEAVTRGGDDLDDGRIEQIGMKVAALAEQMENASSHAGEMEKVATALERIEKGLQDTRSDVVDIARNAAKEVLAEQPKAVAAAPTGEYDKAIEGLQSDLKRLLDAAEGSEERTRNTFSGVQSVLGSLTERLESLERSSVARPSQAVATTRIPQPDLEPEPLDEPAMDEGRKPWRAEGHPLMREKADQGDRGRDRKADFIAAARRAAQAASVEAARMGHHAPEPMVNLVDDEGERTKERAGWFRKVLGRGKKGEAEAELASVAMDAEDTVAPVLAGDRPTAEPEEQASGGGRRKALVYAAAAVVLAIGTLQVFKMVSPSDVAEDQISVNTEEMIGPDGNVIDGTYTDVTSDETVEVPGDVQGDVALVDGPIDGMGAQDMMDGSGDGTVTLDESFDGPADGLPMDLTAIEGQPQLEAPGDLAPNVAFAPPAGVANGFAEQAATVAEGFKAAANAVTTPLSQPANLIASMPPEEIGPIALRSAAAGGNPEAAFLVGVKYTEGSGIEADLAEAARWYQIAADRGLPPAQYRLASLYEKGRGVEKDLEKARAWYEKAASAGNSKAMHNLAVLYAEGQNGSPDFGQAAHWFQQAATHGVQDSLFNLGILYAQGLGVEKNLIESYKWFAIAADQGDRDAAQRRDDVANTMSPADLAAARLAVENFRVLTPDPAANKVITNPEWVTAPSLSTNASSSLESVVDYSGLIREAQSKLNALGFDAGSPDGQAGPRTRNAVREFQKSLGLPETGNIDARLVEELNGQSI